MDHIIEVFRRVRGELNIKMPRDGKTVRLTHTQSRLNGGITHVNPIEIEDALNRLNVGRLKGERA
jgi:hypothetical protein